MNRIAPTIGLGAVSKIARGVFETDRRLGDLLARFAAPGAEKGAPRRRFHPYGRVRPFRQIFFVFAFALAVVSGVGPVVAETARILALGDSLTAGFGLGPQESFPAVLQKALGSKGYDVEVENAGVSGDTSEGALARLDWVLSQDVGAAIVEIGANDMLRGLDPKIPRDNIAAILARLRAKRIPVLLAGVRAAPNLGADYQKQFDAIYPDLARQFSCALYPFFLEGVAGHRDLQLPDGMHPNAKGVEIIVAAILPDVERLIAAAKKARADSPSR